MKSSQFLRMTAAIALAAVASTTIAQSTVYQTGFEPGDGIAAGDLDGQSAWSVDGGTGTVTAGAGAGGSTQFVQLGANSTIARAASTGDDHVLIRGSYQGTGSAVLTAPATANPIAALIGFRTVDASTIAVAAWDGTTSQWVEPAAPVAFSNTAWHEVVVALDYATKTFNVRVDGANHLQNVGFRDVAVTQLNGIGAGSQAAAKVDSIGLFGSGAAGDYDADGWTDKYETAAGNSSPLAGTSTVDYAVGNEPSLGDLNADLNHDAADYALLAANLVNGGTTADMNGDGNADAADVTHYGNRVAGLTAIMR